MSWKLHKKYLFALIPFGVGTIVAFIYGVLMKPQDYPHASYPYRTPWVLSYVSSTWFFFGVVGTVVLWATFAVNDIVVFLEKKSFRRLVRKSDEKIGKITKFDR